MNAYAAATYRETLERTLPPADLLIRLYEGSVRLVDMMKEAMVNGDIPRRSDAVNRLTGILSELASAVDGQEPRELSDSLVSLYLFLIQEVTLRMWQARSSVWALSGRSWWIFLGHGRPPPPLLGAGRFRPPRPMHFPRERFRDETCRCADEPPRTFGASFGEGRGGGDKRPFPHLFGGPPQQCGHRQGGRGLLLRGGISSGVSLS